MTDTGQTPSARERQLDLVIAEYRRRVESGESVDRRRLIAQFPHLADDLRSFFESADETDRHLSGKKTPEISLSDLETLPPGPIADSIAEDHNSAPVSHPKSFGRYEVLKVLGRGAMGIVYLARDSQLERNVALKVPSRDNDEVLRRFHREAKSAANLAHPNICTVYAVDQVEGQPYIAMQYIEGKPLSAYISRDKPMDERKAAFIVRKLAQALSHAHGRGIVHRDLKPSNVMIGEKHEPILTDFGLARQVNNTESVRMTQSGVLLGTPGYMSPEQVEGNLETVGAPSDIYSLGVIFYELLTGQLPFKGSVAAVLAQIVSTDPEKLSSLQPQVDRRLEAICLRMMAKPIGKRFASMQEVADSIAWVLRTPSDRKLTDEDQAAKSTSVKSQQVTVVTTGDAQSLLRTAQRCMQSRDYEQAARLLDAIPERFRDAEIDELQEEATARNDEVNFLLAAIEEADAKQQYQGLLPTVERLLELKPGHRKAFDIYKLLTSRGGQKLATKSSRRPARQHWTLANVPTSYKWIAAAGVTGILFFFAAKWSINRYLGQPNQPNKITQSQIGFEATGTSGATLDAKREASIVPANADLPAEPPVKSPPLLLSAPFDRDTAQQTQAAWASYLNQPVELSNSIGMKLMLIPPGHFTMGSPTDEADRIRDEEGQVRVTLTKVFWLGKYEVTQREWQQVMNSTPWGGERNGDDYPVTHVSWHDANAFCKKLTDNEHRAGRLPADWKYSLPTDAQWEHACRAGTTGRYSFGDISSDLSQFAWFDQNASKAGEAYAHRVGQKRPNAFGLYDMHGNVWELPLDLYSGQVPGGTDPEVSVGRSNAYVVRRGGSWSQTAAQCRSARRSGQSSTEAYGSLGFRVACLTPTTANSVAESPDDSAKRGGPSRTTLTTAEATIRYIDVDRRVLTVDRNASLAVFDVSRNVEILIGGRAATLEALRSGMKGTITFDPDHKVIMKISVASTGNSSSQSDPVDRIEPGSLTARLIGTKWVNSNNATFEWTKQGRLQHNGTDRHWKPLDAQRGQITFGPGHVDTLVFNESLTQFRQLVNGGPNTWTGRRIMEAGASSSQLAGRYRLSATEIRTQKKDPEQIVEIKADGTVHTTSGAVGTWTVIDKKLHIVLRGYKVDPATAIGNKFTGTAVKNNGQRFNFELSKID
jgi:serine/threonine protein kinase/formylglycine-generating enzyme required for sulfatase activity